MNDFTITHRPQRDPWDRSPTDTDEQKAVARNRDIAEMLKILFPGTKINVSEDETWWFPHLDLNEDDYHSRIETTITDNGFLRLTMGACGRKEWKALKMTRQGDVDIIDGDKARAAAKALTDSYAAKLAQVKANQDWRTQKETAEVEAFSKLRPELEAQGVVFSSVGNGGGTILLSETEYGPRIEVLGNTACLKLARHGNDSVIIQPSLIVVFEKLFAQNNVKV